MTPHLLFAKSHAIIWPSRASLTLPWSERRALPEGNGDAYSCLASMLVLDKYRDVPRFLYWTLRIRRQLKHTPGLAGYSLKAEPWKKRFWTLSAWSSKDAMGTFVQSGAHKAMLSDMKGRMANSRFTDWQADAKEIPLRWQAAVRKLNELA